MCYDKVSNGLKPTFFVLEILLMLKTAAVLEIIVPSVSRSFYCQAGCMVDLDVTGYLVSLGGRLALAEDGQKLQKDL